MAPGTGFFLNDTMDDFTIKIGAANMFGLVQGAANAIAPGKRPVSSMAPTIVVKDGKPFLVLGSPGGSRIITAVVQTILNVVDFGMTIQEAVNAPRMHAQWLPDILFAEPYALSSDTVRALVARGHTVRLQKPWGAVEAILIGDGQPASTSCRPSATTACAASARAPAMSMAAATTGVRRGRRSPSERRRVRRRARSCRLPSRRSSPPASPYCPRRSSA